MIKADKGALESDLLQYYGILNMMELPMNRVALFSYYLPNDSRIKRLMSGSKESAEVMILSLIYDALITVFSKDKSNKVSLFDMIVNGYTEQEKDFETWSVDDFDDEWNRRIERLRDNNNE